MVNYKNGKIYALRSHQTEQVYVGSTTQSLAKRKGQHRNNYKDYLKGKYPFISSFELCQYDDMYIELIEEYPCDNKAQLERKEGQWIRKMKICCNKHIAGRTKKEYYEDNKEKRKEYCENNKEKIREKTKEYYENNREKIREKYKEHYEDNKEKIREKAKEYYENNREKIQCECGSIVTKNYLNRHKRTLKHQAWVSKQTE